ncbi:MAG: hypothetical protein ACI32N_10040 [Bulleidia sp.]
MMISPETYYEMNLKGKSQQEILKEIRSLKREIGQLKKSLEDTRTAVFEVFPSRLTRLNCNRNYLDRAIQAYEEAGGTYVMSRAEQKDHDFNMALDSMSKLVFSIGGFFTGFETRTYTVMDDQVLVDVEKSLLEIGEDVKFIPYCKEDFIIGIKNLHIGEWKKTYDDPCVMDGIQWELEIDFNNGRKPVNISGSNAYPYNFEDLKNCLEVEMEDDEYEWDQD